MNTDANTLPPSDQVAAAEEAPEEESPPAVRRLYRWIDLVTALVLALASTATAWCGYQSSAWGGDRTAFSGQSFKATVQSAKYANLATQKAALHAALFGQWATAVSAGDTVLADFALQRFPEPLKQATTAWLATSPLTNSAAPATPFEMPEYALPERAESERWEREAAELSEAAQRADEHSTSYLRFTLVFASALFFAGISGKFRWRVIDLAMLALGAVTLLVGLIRLLALPVY
jgi:hypothetical protein